MKEEMAEAINSEGIWKRGQRAESRQQRAGRGARRGEKTTLQVVVDTDRYLALNDREKHHNSKERLAAR